MKSLLLLGALLLFALTAEAVTIDGYVYREGAAEHSGIQVKFVKVSPSAITDSCQTDSSGHYTKAIAAGIYNVEFSGGGYGAVTRSMLTLIASQTLAPQTLTIYLHGNVRGTLLRGVYHVADYVNVASEDTLTLLPGVRLVFAGMASANISGRIVAEGLPGDSIVFTADSLVASHWNGLNFYNGGSYYASRFAYCTFEKYGSVGSTAYGVRFYWDNNSSFSHCLFRGGINAGGVYSNGAAPRFECCTISGNAGRGLSYLSSAPTLYGCEISANGLSGIECASGASSCPLLLDSSRVLNNGGDGLLFTANGAARITRTEFTGNGGAGVLFQQPSSGCSLLVDSCVFGGNGWTNLNVNGGTNAHVAITRSTIRHGQSYGLFLQNAAYPIAFTDCIVDSCQNSGLFSSHATNVTVARCRFSQAPNAIGMAYSTVALDSCLIADNHGWQGSGLYLINYSTARATACCFLRNTSTNNGGAVYAWASALTLDHCLLAGNSAGIKGGAVAVDHYNVASASTVLTHCTFTGNAADSAGGGLYLESGPATVKNCIVAASSGAGITFKNSVASTVWYNDLAGNSGGAVRFDGDDPAQGPYLVGQPVALNANGDTADIWLNFFADPLFVDPLAGDYRLQLGSPCIDAGDPDLPHDPDGTVADCGLAYFEQIFSASPLALAFGSVRVGAGVTLSCLLRNAGETPITIQALTPSDAHFTVVGFAPNTVLPPHDSLTVPVTFVPDTLRTYSGTLAVMTGYQNKLVSFSGAGIGAYLSATPAALNFGAVESGYPETLSIRLRNTGNATLHFASLSVSGPFAVLTPLDTLAPGDSAQVQMQFNPASQGLFTDSLRIVSDASNGDSLYVRLSGEGGLLPAPVTGLTLNPAGGDAHLTWTPVTTTIHGNPVTVDAYLVAYSQHAGGPFFFHGYTADTAYVHRGVVQFAPAMYYQVTAYVGDLVQLDAALRRLSSNPPIEALHAELRQPMR